MSALLTGFCPNCGSKLKYEDGAKGTITCNACDSSLHIEDLESKSQSKLDRTAIPSFAGFDNPESGVVFLENFFDTYDWESYQQSPEIAVEEIAEVIGNNKVKNGAVPETWYLDFMGLYVPVTKKFEGLASLEKDIIEKFNPVDPTDILSAFDTYRVVARGLLNEREAIEKVLGAAIKYAERFSLAEARLAEMKAGIKTIKDKYATIATKTVTSKDGKSKTAVIDKIEALPAYDTAKNRYATKSAAEFSAKGIDAKDIYGKALSAFKNNEIAKALSLFESIRAYSDSELYIGKINQYFNFWGEVYRINGKHFVYKNEEYKESILPDTLNLKGCAPMRKRQEAKAIADAQAATDAQPATLALSLYEVINGELAEKAAIEGIEQVIATYGTKLFFLKVKKGLACYDLSTGSETIVDEGAELYCRNENGNVVCGVAKHAPVIYIKKNHKKTEDVLPSGCLKKNKKPEVEESPLNPYNLITVDMSTNKTSTVVKEMVDIKLRKDDKIFYTFAYVPATNAKEAKGCMSILDKLLKKPDEGPKAKSKLMVCDLDKGITAQVLDDDCDIQAVEGDNIIYAHWKPNDLNMDLHVYNMATFEDVLIEENIYDFYRIIDGKIYYTIGNSEFRPLVRANFDGSEREQVMRNIKSIEFVRGGWFYVTKGNGYNSLLLKIKIDGSEQRVLCQGIQNINRFEGNLIYYSDVFGNLRSVRIDGKEDRLVVEQVKKVFPAEDGLYYCRDERVGAKETALSLYHMDKDGKNVKKVIFNVDKVQDDAVSNTLYYSKEEKVCYKCYEYGKESEAELKYFKINKYYYIKKSEAGLPAESPVLYLTVGAPKSDAIPEEPKGCLAKLKKEKQVAMIYEEVPIVHSYKNRGLTDDEIAQAEQEEINDAAIRNQLPKWMPESLKNSLVESIKKQKQGVKTNKGCDGCSAT